MLLPEQKHLHLKALHGHTLRSDSASTNSTSKCTDRQVVLRKRTYAKLRALVRSASSHKNLEPTAKSYRGHTGQVKPTRENVRSAATLKDATVHDLQRQLSNNIQGCLASGANYFCAED